MFNPVFNANCDVCGLIFRCQLLNMVTLKDGLFFVCEDCCKKILLVDGWRGLKCSDIKNVLDV